jgi:DNA polymerase elongation subunit (family B)
VGDRIAYVYVAENKSATKQGDKIEEIGYARKKGLHPDTQFYITNQIQNPVAQLFALCLEQMEGYASPSVSYASLMKDMLAKYKDNEEEATLAVLEKKERQLESLLFLGSPPLQKLLRKNRSGPLDAFFAKKV